MLNKTIKLNSGHFMPLVGLGTWQSPQNEVKRAVIASLNAGYKHIDCAAVYSNEKEVGEALRESRNIVDRQDVFITSKLWNTHHGKHVKSACEKTLKDLQLDYLDLYLIHWPLALAFTGLDLYDDKNKAKRVDPSNPNSPVELAHTPIHETWYQMEQLVASGLVKSIGVSNFNAQSLLDLVSSSKIKPAVNQIEVHPYLSQETLVSQSLRVADIRTVAYSPLGSNRTGGPINDPAVSEIAQRLNKTPAQILLRWNIQRGVPVIPKSTNPERIAKNLELFDFELSEQDMLQLNALNRNLRLINPGKAWGYDVFV
jgi:diketogulonate reductase-like aldo/keto reductase